MGSSYLCANCVVSGLWIELNKITYAANSLYRATNQETKAEPRGQAPNKRGGVQACTDQAIQERPRGVAAPVGQTSQERPQSHLFARLSPWPTYQMVASPFHHRFERHQDLELDSEGPQLAGERGRRGCLVGALWVELVAERERRWRVDSWQSSSGRLDRVLPWQSPQPRPCLNRVRVFPKGAVSLSFEYHSPNSYLSVQHFSGLLRMASAFVMLRPTFGGLIRCIISPRTLFLFSTSARTVGICWLENKYWPP